MRPSQTYLVQGDGVAIQIADWGGEGKPLLCLHGLTANGRCFQLLSQALCQSHRLLAMDLRGRALSEKPSTGYSLEHHSQDIKAVLAGLGLESVTLLGHSLGAYLALAFAAKNPGLTSGLVLLDGGAELSPEQWAKVGESIQPSVDRLGKVLPSFVAYLELVRQAPYFDPWSQSIEDYFRYEVEEVEGGVRSRTSPEAIAEERGNLAKVKPSEFYPRIKCPVLILQAGQGMLEPDARVLPPDCLERMLSAMPSAQAVTLQGADHFSIIFQPNTQRDQAILEFLATL